MTPSSSRAPAAVEALLSRGAALAVSVSGGKDSQALLTRLAAYWRRNDFPGDFFVIHADLGRAEWKETPAFMREMCERESVPLVVVRREKGDLVARMQERLDTLKAQGRDSPHWPSAAARYCTAELKRGPINKYLRRYDLVISAEGIRADESDARSKKPHLAVRKAITTKPLKGLKPNDAIYEHREGGLSSGRGRLALTWNAILSLSKADVYETCGHTLEELEERRRLYREGYAYEALGGWTMHPAYVYGNERLSCAMCVIGSRSDILNGARHHPDLLDEYVRQEQEGGYAFRQDLELAVIQRELQQESREEANAQAE